MRPSLRLPGLGTAWLLSWLLTGKLVFTSETALGLVLHHASTAPSPPSAGTDQPIPAALDALVLACLAKEPAARPQTARELSHRLGEIPGMAPWTSENAREWWTAHTSRTDA